VVVSSTETCIGKAVCSSTYHASVDCVSRVSTCVLRYNGAGLGYARLVSMIKDHLKYRLNILFKSLSSAYYARLSKPEPTNRITRIPVQARSAAAPSLYQDLHITSRTILQQIRFLSERAGNLDHVSVFTGSIFHILTMQRCTFITRIIVEPNGRTRRIREQMDCNSPSCRTSASYVPPRNSASNVPSEASWQAVNLSRSSVCAKGTRFPVYKSC
jgi:hypothetical protein